MSRDEWSARYWARLVTLGVLRRRAKVVPLVNYDAFAPGFEQDPEGAADHAVKTWLKPRLGPQRISRRRGMQPNQVESQLLSL